MKTREKVWNITGKIQTQGQDIDADKCHSTAQYVYLTNNVKAVKCRKAHDRRTGQDVIIEIQTPPDSHQPEIFNQNFLHLSFLLISYYSF